MVDTSILDKPSEHLIRFAIAIASGDGMQAAAERLTGQDVPAQWGDELILQSVLMVGWPRALMAMGIWRAVSGRPAPQTDPGTSYRQHEAWTASGQETCRTVYGGNYERLRANVRALHPALDAWMVTEGYGRTLSREGLDLVTRELCTVAQTAMLNAPHQLHSHLRGTLNAGGSSRRIDAVLDVVAEYLPADRQTEVRNLWNEVRRRVEHHAD